MTGQAATQVVRATTGSHLETARGLFLEYGASLGFDLCFQDFEQELADLPGSYAPPLGSILLAFDGESALGCVAVRPLDPPDVAELKRLYVRPAARGRGLGLLLSQRAIDSAREAGYSAIRLDTLDTMTHALALYRRLGFREIDPYRFNPMAGASYWELRLVDP
jgi:ribosomal protein S18 acetylase RimI-like enzyme